MTEISKEKQIDILLQTIDRFWSQAMQNEKQRANFTNYMLLIIGAVQGYIIQRNFDKFSIVLSLIILLLSIFGTIMTMKYYKRFSLQASRVGRLMEKMKDIIPEIDLKELESKADEKQKKTYPVLSAIRLNTLWLYFNYFLIFLGILDIIVCFFYL